MYLKRISLTNFRNFARLELDIPRGTVLIVGDNAQGKTSLLEAIYFLATFTSLHASSDRELINFLAAKENLAVARIVAEYERGGKTHTLEVRIIQGNNGVNGIKRVRKEVLLDGVKKKISELVGHFSAVIFLPRMLAIIDGSPSERRRYLNLALAQSSPAYTEALTTYDRALTRRNALLKQLAERGGDPGQLEFWDEMLASSGAVLMLERIRALREMGEIALDVHNHLTRGDEVLRIDYVPSFDPLERDASQIALPLDAPIDRSGLPLERIHQGFYQHLQEERSQAILRGITTVGPHRDDVRFVSNGVDLGMYGSRGQVRTAVLSLKISEVLWLKRRTGEYPVLLLDEVLAELDPQRRHDLLEHLLESEQALMTTTEVELFAPQFLKQAKIWHVAQGAIDVK